jgi:hypothetical protein
MPLLVETPALVPRTDYASDQNAEAYSPYSYYYRNVVKWCNAALDVARYQAQQSDAIQKMGRYIDYFMGRQWGTGRPSYRAAPVDNRIWRLVWETVAQLTDIRPTFEVKTFRDEYKDTAEMLNNVVRAWWLMNDADQVLQMALLYALFSIGYLSVKWNPQARNGEGEIELQALGPHDVLPLRAGPDLQSAQAVIYQTVRPLPWFEEAFPTTGRLVKPDPELNRYVSQPNVSAGVNYQNLSPAMQRLVRGSATVVDEGFPVAVYREFWIRDHSRNTTDKTIIMGRPGSKWSYEVPPGGRLYPRGRLILMGGNDVILDDQPNPYWHGQFPFVALRLTAVPWEFVGPSEIGQLVTLQDIVNNILAGVIDTIRKAVNPIFLAPKDAFSDEVWRNMDWSMPGAKAMFNKNVPHIPQFGPPPQLPAFVLQTLSLAMAEMDATSGMATMSRAMGKKQVPSADALDRIRETMSAPIRLKSRALEVALRQIGQMFISNVFQFYTAKRRMFMMGTKGLVFEDFDWDPGTAVPAGQDPQEFARQFVFLIQPGSMLNINRIERALLMLRLRAMRDLDRRHLYEALDLSVDVEKVEAELKREMAEQVSMIPPGRKAQREMSSPRQKI